MEAILLAVVRTAYTVHPKFEKSIFLVVCFCCVFVEPWVQALGTFNAQLAYRTLSLQYIHTKLDNMGCMSRTTIRLTTSK